MFKAFYGAAITAVTAITDLFQSLIFTFHFAATQSSISAHFAVLFIWILTVVVAVASVLLL